jgi:hypothetical protein
MRSGVSNNALLKRNASFYSWDFFLQCYFIQHHGMARTQVTDRGDSIEIWRVAAIILNKQLRIADKGCLSNSGVGPGTNNPQP